MRKRLIEVERATTLALVGKALGQRKRARRARTERRQTIRWEPKKADRRARSGHRKEDKTLDCIRSAYQSPPPRRRTPKVAPLRVDCRLAQRHVTDVKVFAYDGSDIKPCRLRDISPDGAFLEAKNFALAEGTQLDLVLRICRDGKTIACPLPAKVVRVEVGGAALKFGHLDEQADNTLLKIVKPFKQKPNAKVRAISSTDQRFPRRV